MQDHTIPSSNPNANQTTVTTNPVANPQQQAIDNQSSQEGISYDIVPLPSDGLFYENGVKEAKVYYLTASDEAIMTSPNIIASGRIIDEILKRKVKLEYGMQPNDLTVGDKLALLVYLRAQFEPMYRITLNDDNGKPFVCEYDLRTLGMKKSSVKPNEKGYFQYTLPRSKSVVEFRLLNGKDEKIIKEKNEAYIRSTGDKDGRETVFTHERQIVSINGVTDPNEISKLVATMPLKDSRTLMKYVDSVTPTLDTTIKVATPQGGTFSGNLPFTPEFLFPTIEL